MSLIIINRKQARKALALPVILLALTLHCAAQTSLGTQTLQATVQPLGSLVSIPATVSLTGGGFLSFTGSLNLQYLARTTTTSGGGSITLKAQSDFSPTGGPAIAKLQYTCSAATLGTSCSGTQTVSLTATPVVTLPSSACTGSGGSSSCPGTNPQTATVNFSLPDNPVYKTGTYSVTLTLTISAT